MPKYISLVKYTPKGVENVEDSPNRLDAVKKLCKSMDARVESFYLTMGQYDMVLIMDAPDSATVAKLILKIASQGSVSTETLPAFTEEEYREIITYLP